MEIDEDPVLSSGDLERMGFLQNLNFYSGFLLTIYIFCNTYKDFCFVAVVGIETGASSIRGKYSTHQAV